MRTTTTKPDAEQSACNSWYATNAGNDFQGAIVDEKTGRTVAIAYDKADAPLLAASRDLLRALEVLVEHAQETYPHFEDVRGQKDIRAALAAIAKAKGGE